MIRLFFSYWAHAVLALLVCLVALAGYAWRWRDRLALLVRFLSINTCADATEFDGVQRFPESVISAYFGPVPCAEHVAIINTEPHPQFHYFGAVKINALLSTAGASEFKCIGRWLSARKYDALVHYSIGNMCPIQLRWLSVEPSSNRVCDDHIRSCALPAISDHKRETNVIRRCGFLSQSAPNYVHPGAFGRGGKPRCWRPGQLCSGRCWLPSRTCFGQGYEPSIWR